MKVKSVLITAVLATVLLSFSISANAQTTDMQALITQIRQQITQLQAQIVQLQAQQGTITAPAWCHTFNTNLRIGDSGMEISSLVRALEKENIYISGGQNLPTTFNDQVSSAVIVFQEKYASKILTPYGLK